MDRDEVMRVLRAFESAGLEYVLIGAAAMGLGTLRSLDHADAAVLRERFGLKDEG